MRSKSNPKKDKFFLRLVETGRLSVTKSGVITNTKTGNVLGKNNPKTGYVRISFQHPKTKKIYCMLAHRLVWIVFNGLIPDPEVEVNHKNGNKRCNRLSNLELVTSSGNSLHAYATGLKDAVGENNGQAIFKDRQVVGLRKKFFSGKIDIDYITEKYKCHWLTARQMLMGETYSHLGFSQPIPPKERGALVGHETLLLRLHRKGYSNTAISDKLAKRGIRASRSAVQRALSKLAA